MSTPATLACADCGIYSGPPCPTLGYYICEACAHAAERLLAEAMADLKRIAERDQRRRAAKAALPKRPMLRRFADGRSD